MGDHTLRISIQTSEHDAVIKLEGRIAGPWAQELERTWKEQGPALASQRKLTLDLREITFSDNCGTQILKQIYSQTGAELIVGNQWTQFLAEEVMRDSAETSDGE